MTSHELPFGVILSHLYNKEYSQKEHFFKIIEGIFVSINKHNGKDKKNVFLLKYNAKIRMGC